MSHSAPSGTLYQEKPAEPSTTEQGSQPSSIEQSTAEQGSQPSSIARGAQENYLASLLQELRRHDGKRGSMLGASMSSAVAAVWANRARSLLTMLGIIIGIVAVIGALTLVQGVGDYIDSNITSQGTNLIKVYGRPPSAAKSAIKQAQPTLMPSDLQTMKTLPHMAGITPLDSTSDQVVYGNQNWLTTIEGVSADAQSMQNWQIAEGLWFSSSEDVSGSPVAVLGDTVYHNLFDSSGTDPIGQKIRIRDQVFRVEGVLAAKGGPGQDDVIFVPDKALQTRLTNETNFAEIDVEADDPSNVDALAQDIAQELERNHRIASSSADDFQIKTAIQALQQDNQATQSISLLLTSVATISLTVGGIGIMNIMLVSVTERTREIGIRVSIGARRADIWSQFLLEALLLCLLGGAIGLLLGILVGWVMLQVILALLAGTSINGGIPLIITPLTLILPFAVSLAVGLVFGLYPAIRASRLDPIIALRKRR